MIMYKFMASCIQCQKPILTLEKPSKDTPIHFCCCHCGTFFDIPIERCTPFDEPIWCPKPVKLYPHKP